MNILYIDIEDKTVKEFILKLADSRINFINYGSSDMEINDFSVVIYSNFMRNESRLKKLRGLNRNSKFIYILDHYKNDTIQKAINAQLVDYLYFKNENYVEKVVEILNTKNNNKILDAKVENKSLNMAKSMVTSFYIYNLIYGDMKNLDMLIDLVEKYNLEINPNLSIVLMIDNFWEEVRFLDNKNRYEIKKEYLDFVNYFIDKNNIQAIASTLFGTDKITILLNIDKDNQKDSIKYSTKLAIKLKEYINLKAKHTVTIGVGSIFQNPKYLWKSYEEAFKSLDYSFYLGSDKVIHFEETKDLTIYNDANKNKLPQSSAMGIMITNGLYKERKYTDREASIIVTGFSAVAITFMIVVADNLGFTSMWNTFFASALVVTFLTTAITARLRPLSKMNDTYYNNMPANIDETRQGNVIKSAIDEDFKVCYEVPPLHINILNYLKDAFELVLEYLPNLMSIGLAGLLLAEYTPLFDYLGYIFYPITLALRIPEPLLAAKATILGLAEMYLPVLLLKL